MCKMNPARIFSDPKMQFKVIGPAISKSQIELAVPEVFVGKDDFVQFYLSNNGGYFRNFAFIYRDLFQRVTRKQVNSLEILGFFSIPRKRNDALSGVRSITQEREVLLRAHGNNKSVCAFIKSHIPIGFDGSGDDHWLDLSTGRIRFLDMESVENGPIEVAPSFIDLVANLVGNLREEDRF